MADPDTPPPAEPPKIECKVVLLGDSGVGKTSLTLQFVRGVFDNSTSATVGASYLTKTLAHEEHKVTLQIWDTAGQDRFRSLAPMYYRGAEAAIIVYDITNRISFDKSKEWLQEIITGNDDHVVLMLVGNKIDLEASRQVSTSEATEYAAEVNAVHVELTASDYSGVEALFQEVARRLAISKTNSPMRSRMPTPSTILLDLKKNEATKGGCCS